MSTIQLCRGLVLWRRVDSLPFLVLAGESESPICEFTADAQERCAIRATSGSASWRTIRLRETVLRFRSGLDQYASTCMYPLKCVEANALK
jgi:hypothetical protein